MQWSPKQAYALDRIASWLADPQGQLIFYLGGLAGSGKSTLVEHIVKDLTGRICYAAPTGKAALNMRNKGCPSAKTIHQLCFRPAGGEPPSPAELQRLRDEIKRLKTIPAAQATVEKLTEQLARAEQDVDRKGLRFSLNLDSELRGARLGIVDEISMVDRQLGEGLESFGTPLLVIGDPAQLPPVYGAGYFTSREPDVFLDEVHRQALDSPILQLADLARRGRPLPYGEIGPGVDVRRQPAKGDTSLEPRALDAEMIIVGRNKTRHACNAKLRRLRGHEAPAPQPGERVICLRNDHELGLLNGSTWRVERCVPNYDDMTATLEAVSLDNGAHVECSTWLHHFMGREEELGGHERRRRAEFAHAAAITCHKAQASQWDDVLLFDESKQFGKDASKWLYTALTRASKTLTVVQ